MQSSLFWLLPFFYVSTIYDNDTHASFLQRITFVTLANNAHDGCWALKSHFNDTSTISYREIQLLPWQTIPKRVWWLSTTTPCMKGNNDAVFILLILPCHYILYVVLSCGYLQQHLAGRVISQSWCCCFFTCDSKTHVKQVKSGAVVFQRFCCGLVWKLQQN